MGKVPDTVDFNTSNAENDHPIEFVGNLTLAHSLLLKNSFTKIDWPNCVTLLLKENLPRYQVETFRYNYNKIVAEFFSC